MCALGVLEDGFQGWFIVFNFFNLDHGTIVSLALMTVSLEVVLLLTVVTGLTKCRIVAL